MHDEQARLERARGLMMAALDEELDAAQQHELDALLEADPELREEWERLQRVKEVTREMQLRKPPEEVWGIYWTSVYNRLERGVGWILLSLGATVLLVFGGWELTQALLADTDLPPLVKLAVFAVVAGLAVLGVSVAREKWFVSRRDPYRGVER